jgi:anhydro-N-acetylmuramic acid kinase
MASPADSRHHRRFAGVMTGTSMDAIDVAIICLEESVTLGNITSSLKLEHFHSRPLDGPLVEAMLDLQHASDDELHRAALIANAYADAVSRAVLEALAGCGLAVDQIAALGVHGQTIRHQPGLGYTIQLNAPARIAEAVGIDVVSDFRSRDIAAGGQGAPLVPAFHQAIFGQHPVAAVVNIGGIANITYLGDPPQGFDTGPGNMLMDAWARRHLGRRFDDDGRWAAGGSCHAGLLNAMCEDPFFKMRAPKSTGRDAFNMQWLERLLGTPAFASVSPQDVQATLLMLTAQTIAKAFIGLRSSKPDAAADSALLVCGGVAANSALMSALQQAIRDQGVNDIRVASTAHLGWDPQTIEAAAFAWLASRTVDRLSGNIPAATGALGPRVLGAITPK